MSSFGAALRRHRVGAGLSQNELARRAGVDAAHVNRLEKGSRPPPGRETALALVGALGLDQREADRLLVAAGHAPQIDWQSRAERAESRLAAIRRTLFEDDPVAEEPGSIWVVH